MRSNSQWDHFNLSSQVHLSNSTLQKEYQNGETAMNITLPKLLYHVCMGGCVPSESEYYQCYYHFTISLVVSKQVLGRPFRFYLSKNFMTFIPGLTCTFCLYKKCDNKSVSVPHLCHPNQKPESPVNEGDIHISLKEV